MKIVKDMPYKKHVLVCVNEREPGKECCAAAEGAEIFFALKKWVAEKGLINSVWVTRTRCLGFCNAAGATVVVYPERVWFLETTMGELEKVKEEILKEE